ncbi:MAG: T9SS type A sorting domain-containing protein [Bacteroidia bacterium]|nr:T9SS type A sorting domain-containing protein [Bacteroidia bacterium]
MHSKHLLKPIWLTLFLLGVLQNALSQNNLWKVSADSTLLKFPWTGGLDACQFAALDLNMDGVDDLVVFDRRGNRWLCFLNDGLPGQISYSWAPQYVRFFPQVSDWVVFADYDGDGKPDLFTYSPGWAGIRVFKNTSTTQPQFTLVVDPYLSSLQGGGYVNIISTNADQLGIADLDDDGDIDLLTFWALGTFVEQHTNKSKEFYGHADSLIFEKTSFCWGRIAESEENSTIYLDTCLFSRKSNGFRHRGATMLVHDFTGNGLPDLLLGDVDFPGLNLLINEGTQTSALIVAQDTLFPSNDVPVRLFSMPAAFLIDVNNDGLKDLIVSPFDPNFDVTENYSSIWLYLNEGSATQPLFRLHTKRFLQDQTIDLGSGAYPVMVDLNGDGLKDIIAGNIGRYVRSWFVGNTLHSSYESSIHVFRQQGTPEGITFTRTSRDLAGLSSLGLRGLVPAFADISGNGLPDMLVGSENGGLIYVAQKSPGDWVMRSTNFGGIQTPPWSAPSLFDLDEDGISDLMIGSVNGRIIFYKGSKIGDSLGFQFVKNNLGGIDVTDYNVSYDGFSVPQGFIAPDGSPRLVVGSESGKVWLFGNIRGNINGNFAPLNDWQSILDTLVTHIDAGFRSAAFVGQLGNDQKLHMLTGNFSGGLELWNGTASVFPGIAEKRPEPLKIWPNPSNGLVYFETANTDCLSALIRIYDNASRLAVSKSVNLGGGKRILDVKGLKPGVYIFEMRLCTDELRRSKFVKLP